MKYDYDILVIGTGPGGEGAAMKSVKEGKHVAVIDNFKSVGGNSTHRGTIPSKALRHYVQQMMDMNVHRTTSFPDLLNRAADLIKHQVDLRTGYYERNDIDIILGRASFIDEHTVEVALLNGGLERYTAAGFILATGSRPYQPDDIDFSHPRICDSDSILLLQETPRNITIYGAGVIGCEYASIFRGLRIKVSVINSRSQLLSYLDVEIIDALSYHLSQNGVHIRHNEVYDRVEANDKEVRLHLQSNKQIVSDVLLWAQGRTGNSDRMGLETIGVETNERGSILINENYQSTTQPHIYAIGDVVGFPSLASAAYDQGRFAATHLIFGECEHQLVEDIPTGIYTIPEISSIGLTEKELTADKVPYEVGYAYFRHIARAQLTDRLTGMLKIIFHRESFEILGIHCFGSQASEIIHIGQAVMAQTDEANTLMYFINTTFNYPTMAEAYRVAALNGLNRVK